MTIIRKSAALAENNGNLILRIKSGETILIDNNISIIIQVDSATTAKVVVNAPQHIKVRRKAYEERRNEVQRKTSEET